MDLIAEYDQRREAYNSLAKTMADLINRLIDARKISYHSISFRCKTKESFERKVDIKQSYSALEDITDLAGVRVITHFSDDVDVVAGMIESEFKIDRANSIDKRAALDPDRFGYLSLHYVVSLKKEREILDEYAAFKGLKLEIQIRSILQHTWAEIEHDIGYKSSVEVPKVIKRKFSRMAGLLELADQEFVAIRSELSKYQKNMLTEAAKSPEKVLLDKVTYLNFVRTDEKCLELDAEAAAICRFKYMDEPKNVAKQLQALSYFGIETVEQLSKTLVDFEDDIRRRLQDIASTLSLDKASTASPGVCVFYLTQLLAAKSGDEHIIDGFLKIRGLAPSFKSYLLNFYQV
ncbi:GTP pyrophosphokinase YjbM [compost metagenome]